MSPSRLRLFLALAACVFTASEALAQSWEWIRTAGAASGGWQYGQGIARDDAGNLYITRNFLGTSSFGDGTTFTSENRQDGFIAKYSADGAFVWARQFGGTGDVFPLAMAVDGAGNSYVTGYFNGMMTVGAASLSGGVPASRTLFILKFDPLGNALWGRQAAVSDDSAGLAVVANAAGRIWVTGEYLFPTSVNGFAIGNVSTAQSGGFLLSLDTNGTILWGQAIGNTSSNSRPLRGSAVAIDPLDNAYLAGRISGNVNFSGLTLQRSTYSGFIAKYDASGQIEWINATTGDDYAEVRAIAVDALGQAYVTGEFFNNLTVGTISLTRAGNVTGKRDVWVAKLDSVGEFLWGIRGGGTEWDEGRGIAIDAAGNAFVTGFLEGGGGSATFGNLTYTPAAGFSPDVFVAKVSPAGEALWITQTGSFATKYGRGIVVDPAGNSYVAGMTGGPASNALFGNLTPTMEGGSWHTFIAKLSSDGSALPPAPVLSSFSPASGLPGTTVTLTGNHLSGTASVTFNGVPATFTVLSATQVSVVVPDGASTGPVRVTTLAGAASGPSAFTVPLPLPILSAVTPGAGKVGETVTVTGQHLGQTTGVTLSGKAANFTVVSGEQVEVTIPADAASGPLRVTTTGGSAFVAFTVQESASWDWLTVFSGPGDVYVYQSQADAEGNVYAVGYARGEVSVGGLSLTTAGGYHPFVVKLDPDGNPLWRQIRGGGGDSSPFQSPALGLSPNGEVVFAASFGFNATFAGSTLTAGAFGNTFLARLSSDGNLLGIQTYGGAGVFEPRSMAINAAGEIYLLGRFMGFNAAYGSSTLTNMTGSADLLLLKLNATGSVLWARQGRTPQELRPTDLGLDAEGNVYLSGTFRESLQLGTTTLTTTGSNDIFLAKYSPAGVLLWTARTTSDNFDPASVFAVSPGGQTYLGGSFGNNEATIRFGSLELTGSGSFFASFDANGEPLWARVLPIAATGIALNANNEPTIAGLHLTQNRIAGFAFKRLDRDGNLLESDPTVSTSGNFFRGVALLPNNDPVLTGQLTSDVTLAGRSLSHTGGANGFVGRLARAGGADPGIYGVFPSAAQAGSGSEWFYIDWFGLGWVRGPFYPWIYHLDHGWLYCAGNSEQVFLYDMNLGWLFTGPSYGDYFFRYSTGSWILHLRNSSVATGGRWFYNQTTKTWRVEDAP